MKNAFAIVTLSATLSACSWLPSLRDQVFAPAPRADAKPVDAKPADAKPADAKPADAKPAGAAATDGAAEPSAAAIAELVAAAPAPPERDSLPGVVLSSELFYQITSAELEFKVGRWQSAYATMLRVARQTRDPRVAQRAVEMALAAKQGAEALAAIRLWRELAPHSEDATQYLLGFMVLGEQMGEAEAIFSERLKNAPPGGARGIAMFQMQQFLTRAKDKAAAFALLDRVLEPYGATQEARLVLAQGAYAAGDGARAVQEARRALQIKPDSELALLTLAQVTPDAQAAAELLTTFLASYPAAREVRSAYVRTLVEQKRFDAAREQFRIQLKDQPDNLGTLYALGVVSMQLEDGKVAEAYFKQYLAVLAARPDEERDAAKVLMILSQLAEDRDDFNAAVEWLDKIDAGEPRAWFSARIRRAQLMARHGDLSGARQALAELASEDAEEQARALQADAQLLREAGDSGAAYAALAAALKRFPEHTGLLYDFALAAEKLDQPEVMEASLRRVIALDPANHHAYNALGYSLAERNVRLAEARELIGQALKMAPNDPFIMDSMGWVEFRLGGLAQAEQLLRRAYALRADAEIAVHLGEVLWQKGDKAEAQRMWREAQAKDPKNDALKSTLARLNVGL